MQEISTLGICEVKINTLFVHVAPKIGHKIDTRISEKNSPMDTTSGLEFIQEDITQRIKDIFFEKLKMLSFVSNTLADKKMAKLYFLDDDGDELKDFDEDLVARRPTDNFSGMLTKGQTLWKKAFTKAKSIARPKGSNLAHKTR